MGLPDSPKQRSVTFFLQRLDRLFWQGVSRPFEAVKAGVEVDEGEFQT
jgi:hypothetical protein